MTTTTTSSSNWSFWSGGGLELFSSRERQRQKKRPGQKGRLFVGTLSDSQFRNMRIMYVCGSGLFDESRTTDLCSRSRMSVVGPINCGQGQTAVTLLTSTSPCRSSEDSITNLMNGGKTVPTMSNYQI